MGIPKLLPAQLRVMEALLPQVPVQETLPELIPAQGDRRRRVGLLLGCVQRVLFPQVNAATARVLAAGGMRGGGSRDTTLLRGPASARGRRGAGRAARRARQLTRSKTPRRTR
jgi:hypothetical protein